MYGKASVASTPVARSQVLYPLIYRVQIDSIVVCHTRLSAHHAETLRGVFDRPFAVAASTNAGPALGAAPGGRVVLGVIVEFPLALGTGL
jgi:hypothetical protein